MWDGNSLEELLKEAILNNQPVQHLFTLIKLLNEDRRAYYRDLVKKLLAEKKAKDGNNL